MADRIIKSDSGNDVVISNDDASGKIEINDDGTINFTGTASKLVPSNLVAYRASSQTTPSGWSEYTTARGRMIVGLPSGGTDGGTVGTAFTNAQDKSKSIAHTHTGPSHAHQIHKANLVNEGNFQFSSSPYYSTSGTFTSNSYMNYSGSTSSSNPIPVTNTDGTGNTGAMSANSSIVTSDFLAYIQLMTIKKD